MLGVVVGSGVAGALVGGLSTYTLTFDRERRRSAEGYRVPQRQAVADIMGAIFELDARAALSVEAVDAAVKEGAGYGAQRLSVDPKRVAPAVNDVRAAAADVWRAYQLARIVLVDPQCREALGVVRDAVLGLDTLFRKPNPKTHLDASLYPKDLIPLVRALDGAAEHLVDVAASRLGPVASLPSLWRSRRRG